jgi:hypothetical protein
VGYAGEPRISNDCLKQAYYYLQIGVNHNRCCGAAVRRDFSTLDRQGVHLTGTLGHLGLKSPVNKGPLAKKKPLNERLFLKYTRN